MITYEKAERKQKTGLQKKMDWITEGKNHHKKGHRGSF